MHCTIGLVHNGLLTLVADYPLCRAGSCLRPGVVRRPVISVWKTTFCKSWIFPTLFRSFWKERREKMSY